MKKYGFVYIWKEKILNKYYIGSHWGTEDDGYICSSDSMRKQYKRHPKNFKRRILSYIRSNKFDLLKEEQRWLDMIKPEEFGIKYYNLSSNVNFSIWWMNEETKKQVSLKISKALKGNKKLSDAIKLSHKTNPRCLSEETKRKIGLKSKGRIPWNKGKIGSQIPWNKGKIGSQIPWNKGKTGMKNELRQKISQTLKMKYQNGNIKPSSTCFQKGHIPWNRGI